MHPALRNTLAVIAGVVIGGTVNMVIVQLGPVVIPLPEGADVSTMEGLRESMPLFGPQHFISPFLAHALGTLVGAAIAARIAVSHRMALAVGIGCFFLIGGIAAASMIGGPLWFTITDLVLAYLPMGVLGGMLGRPRRPAAH